MKQLISRILIFSLVVLVSCMENTGGRGQQQQHRSNKKNHYNPPPPPSTAPDNGSAASDEVIDRHPGKLIYTKHARCRMDCRHIDEAEVEEILANGRINYRKSEPAGRPDPKYALEGNTRDGQQVRIIFAPAKRGMVVITVIDLDTDWSCNCK